MSNAEIEKELQALRQNLPEVVHGTTPSKTAAQHYSHDLAKRIVAFRAEGLTLYQISLQNEMPSHSTLIRWTKTHPEFSALLRAVRDSRALIFEDKVLETAENAQGKDADRIKLDAYKWAAEVNDPETYGKKVAHSGEVKGTVVLQVVTGFGPPNAWQTPPKLKADGTIDREEKEVESEVADARPISPKDAERAEPQTSDS